MKIAIIGAGAIAKGYAAYLAARKHKITLWSPSGRDLGRITSQGLITATGLVEGEFSVSAAGSAQSAVEGAEVILFALPANGHATAIAAVCPHLQNGQSVIISAQLSLSALLLAEKIRSRGLSVPVFAWATTVIAARSTAADQVEVSLIRKRLDIAAVPATETENAARLCETLFDVAFDRCANLLAITLSNLNPPAHMAIALCNLTRMEKGEDFSSYGGITHAVGNFLEDLDRERHSLAAAFGLSVRSIQDHYVHSFGVERAGVGAMAQTVATLRPNVKGPKTLDTRFVTEDIPFGILPLIQLGDMAGIDMPLHRSGGLLMSSLYRRDFSVENDIMPNLQLDFEGLLQKL